MIYSFNKNVLNVGQRPSILAGQQGYDTAKGIKRT